jgi:hypothetical protein
VPVQAPPRPPDRDELEDALIEEARRRARRRRRSYAAVVALALLVGAGLYLAFGNNGGGGSGSRGGPSPGGATRFADALFVDAGPSDHLIAVDTHTGRARTLPIRLDCGDAEFCLVASGGELVIGSVGRTHVYDPSRPGPPRGRRLGRGWIVIPSATDGRIWLGLLERPTRRARKLRTVREETVGGRVTQSVRPPGEDWPANSVKAGLLFQSPHGLRLWDPRTQSFTRRLPGPFPVDTHDNLVASCGEPCPRFDLTNVRTGTVTRVKPPIGYSFRAGYDGAFSPDGSLLALPVVADRGPGPPRHGGGWAMALVGVRTGMARVIKRSTLDPDYQAMSWSASGGRLFFGAAGGRIIAYRLGSQGATNLAHVRGPIYQMAAP